MCIYDYIEKINQYVYLYDVGCHVCCYLYCFYSHDAQNKKIHFCVMFGTPKKAKRMCVINLTFLYGLEISDFKKPLKN